MALIDKETIRAEIERRKKALHSTIFNDEYNELLAFLDTLPDEPNIRFPQERNIIEKVFGAGNLESWEYDEAEALVKLAKEELMKDMQCQLDEALELVAEYNLKPYRDGNAWCLLLGKDIQSGICGFGNTLTEAYLDFLKSYKEYKHPIGELLNGLQEQPVEGLEEELENYAKLYPFEDAGSYRNLITLARHFYELGLNARKEE